LHLFKNTKRSLSYPQLGAIRRATSPYVARKPTLFRGGRNCNEILVGCLNTLAFLRILGDVREEVPAPQSTQTNKNKEGAAAGEITGLENQLIVACAQGTPTAVTAAKYLREKVLNL